MNKKLLLFLSSLLLFVVLVPMFSYTPALNVAAKAFILSAIMDTSSSTLSPLIPNNALVMHPTFVPKRSEISKPARASIDDFDDYFFSKDFPLSLDDTERSLLKPFRSFRMTSFVTRQFHAWFLFRRIGGKPLNLLLSKPLPSIPGCPALPQAE